MIKLVLILLILIQFYEPGEKLFSTALILLYSSIYYYTRTPKVDLSKHKDFNVIIIGAGFSGLGMAIKLKQMGIPFVIIDKAKEVGGTWWYNRYPGCACDIPSHLYSFSFEPNPNWTEVFPRQEEIEDYLIGCAKKHDLYSHARLETTFLGAKWNAENAKWTVRVEKHGKVETLEANAVVSGVGGLHVPNYPSIPGMEKFSGLAFHSSDWSAHFDPTKHKRVAIIGAAASAIQITPELAKDVDNLYVFQRTPNWITPRPNGPYSEGVRSLLARSRVLCWLLRLYYYLRQELIFLIAFRPNSLTSRFNTMILRRFIDQTVKDKKTFDGGLMREALTPKYPPGCKRILISSDYYRALRLPNVELVTNPIHSITERGVVVKHGDGEHLFEVDAIVYATGFAVMNQIPEIINGQGKDLSAVWGDKPAAYLGVMTPEYPNIFTLLGPNTGLGHNSVVWMIECQVNFIAQCLQHLVGHKEIEVKRSVFEKLDSKIQSKLKDSIWDRKYCVSWYQNSSGYLYTLWYGHTFSYWYHTLFAPRSYFDLK